MRDQPTTHILVAVGVVRRTGQSGLLANAHLGDSLIPASDDLADSEFEGEWFVSGAGGVEYFAVGESASVVDGDVGADFGFVSVAGLGGFNLELHLNDLNISLQYQNS